VILLVRNETVAYVQANPSASVQWSGTLAVGAEIGVELELIPRSRTSYNPPGVVGRIFAE
jgi:hypothetical protein